LRRFGMLLKDVNGDGTVNAEIRGCRCLLCRFPHRSRNHKAAEEGSTDVGAIRESLCTAHLAQPANLPPLLQTASATSSASVLQLGKATPC